MLNLCLETSTERGFVSLFDGVSQLFYEELPFGHQNSTHLLPMIHKAISTCGLSPKQLQFISTGIGPGSYTGIRVGAITAKALAYALNIPVIGICSLDGFVPDEDGDFAALIDAKIGGVYLQCGTKKGSQLISQPPEVCELEKAGMVLDGVQIALTPNAKILKPKLDALYPNLGMQWQEMSPNPSRMTKLALEKYEKGEFSTDSRLELLYLRKTQAEIEKERSSKALE
jgi:tRNA threonylcarbamoyladenosine biosynthesis protein TsaB